jgi:hypothetical protein
LDIPANWILFSIVFGILGVVCVALAGKKLFFFLKYSGGKIDKIISLPTVVLTLEICTNIGM